MVRSVQLAAVPVLRLALSTKHLILQQLYPDQMQRKNFILPAPLCTLSRLPMMSSGALCSISHSSIKEHFQLSEKPLKTRQRKQRIDFCTDIGSFRIARKEKVLQFIDGFCYRNISYPSCRSIRSDNRRKNNKQKNDDQRGYGQTPYRIRKVFSNKEIIQQLT